MHIANRLELGALEDRIAQRKAALDAQYLLDEALIATLIAMAPEDVREYLKSERVVKLLVANGQYCDATVDIGDFGFTSIEDAVEKLGRLSEAWKGHVEIHITSKHPLTLRCVAVLTRGHHSSLFNLSKEST